MNRTGATLFRWLGGLLLVMALYVLVSGFWAPRGVQFLNRVVCDPYEHIDNRGAKAAGGDTDSLELVCRGPAGFENAMGRMVSVSVVFALAGACCFTLSNRMQGPTIRAPQHVHHM